MTRARLALLVTSLAVLGLTVYVAALLLQPAKRSAISFESFQKLKVGMTRKQVETILGGPARLEVRPYHAIWAINHWHPEHWSGEECRICVHFDSWDKVSGVEFYPPFEMDNRYPPTIEERIRSWMPW